MVTPDMVTADPVEAVETGLEDINQPALLVEEVLEAEVLETGVPEVGLETAQAPDEAAQLRTENARLTQEVQKQQQLAEDTKITEAAGQYAQRRAAHYVQNQGMDEETANYIGNVEAEGQMYRYQALQQKLRADRMEISQQFGVPVQELAGFNDEAAMRHHAEQYSNTIGPQAKELAAMKKEIADLKKGQVPANQKFNQPSGSGRIRVTSQNIDALHLAGKITDARYRRFLDSGA